MGHAAAMLAGYANGGKVPGRGKGDHVRALLDPREVVLPADTVKAVGLGTLKALIAATHKTVKTKGPGRVRRMANGGLVGDDPLEQQRASDQATVGGAASKLGAAGADLLTLPARAAAGVIDSTVIRGVRALGANAGYLSPALTPPGADPASMTPYSDRLTQPAPEPVATAPAAAAAPLPPRAVDSMAAYPAGSSTPIATVNNASGVTVPEAPGVSKFTQGGRTLYTNVAGDNGAALAPRGPVTQQNADAAQALSDKYGAVGRLAAAAPAAPAGDGSYIPGVTAPPTQWQTELAARNATVKSNEQPFGGVVAQLAREHNDAARDTARIAAQATLAGHQIGADATRYSVDTGARTAAARLATETPEIQARTADLGAQAATRQQVSAAQQALVNAKTPEEQQSAEERLRALGVGRDRNYPEISKTHVVPPKVNFDGSKEPGYVVTTDQRSGHTTITKLAEDAAGGAPAAGAAPSVGTVKNGYRFKGGDPSKQASWEKV